MSRGDASDRGPIPRRPLDPLPRSRRVQRIFVESLESRTLLTALSWAVDASGDWNTASNWSPAQVPGPGDDVIIDRSVPVLVTISSGNQSVASLEADADQSLVVAGGSLTLNSLSSASDVTVSNNAVVAVASLEATNLTLQQGGIVTAQSHELDLTVSGAITIDATSRIDVSAEGYGPRVSPGGTLGTNVELGGSYGGLGGVSSGQTNAVYGDYTNPTDWGSGGWGYANGGAGGGLVRLTAGTLALNGQILANGSTAPDPVGGAPLGPGSGGGIYVAVTTLQGSGSIEAAGASTQYSSGGGGGRVAVYAGDWSQFDLTKIQAPGGVNSDSGTAGEPGGAGTVYLKQTGAAHGTLIVNAAAGGAGTTPLGLPGENEPSFTDPVMIEGSGTHATSASLGQPLDFQEALTVSSGAVLAVASLEATNLTLQQGGIVTAQSHELDLTVSGAITIDATSRIDVSAEGYGPRVSPGGTLGTNVELGGSYGGLGGVSSGQTNAVYGDYTNPTDWGSGGWGYANGGAGGGLVRLTAGTLALNGQILANGSTAPDPVGGAPLGPGSGGGIYVAVTTLQGSGSIEAAGASTQYSSGGGGGRVAVYAGDWSQFDLTKIQAPGGVNSDSGTAGEPGGAGTVYLKQTGAAHGTLIVNAAAGGAGTTPLGLPGATSYSFVDPVVIEGSGTHAQAVGALVFQQDLTIQDSASLDISGTLTEINELSWTDGSISGSGALMIAQSAQIVVASSSDEMLSVASLVNNGIVEVNSGTMTIKNTTTLDNQGIVEANGGSATISGTVNQVSGSTLTGGTWIIMAGSTLNITSAGNLTANDGNVTLSGAGSTFSSINTVASNTGSLSVLGGKEFMTVGDLRNSGSVTLGAGSDLTVDGNYSQTGAGTTTIEVGGPSTSGQFGQLNASGKVTLAGTLNINQTGLGIQRGDSFPIMDFTSRQGTFAATTGLYAGRTQVLSVAQNDTSVTVNALVDTATLAVTSVAFVPAMQFAGQAVTVTYTVNNIEDLATPIDSWYDSVYLSSGTTVTPSSELIARVQHTGVVDGLGSYTETETASLPGVVPGAYHILVICDSRGLVPDFNRTEDVGVASDTIGVDIPTLTPNTPITGTIDSGQSEYFQVSLPAGTTVRVTAGVSVAGGAALLTRYQDVPDLSTYDEYDLNANLRTQQVVLANNQAGTYYIVLQGQENAAGGQPFTLTAQELSLAVLGATPSTGGNGGDTTVTVQGAEFSPATAVSLVDQDGTKHPAAAVFYKDSSTLFATFDLTGLPTGPYDVRVDDHGLTDSDAGAFTVTTGGGGDVVYNMSAPNFVRDGSMGTVTVTYDNIGSSDAPAPLLAVIGTNAVLRLPDQTDFAGSTVQFLAISTNGPVGILPPGQIGHITMYFQASPTAPPGSQISFELGLGATDQPINWASDKANLQPPSVSPDAWNAIWSNFLAQVGSTAGDLQSALDKDADYLSQFGEYDYDVTPLMSFELQKADDFGAISQRYTLGAFGLGQPDPTSLLATTDSFGNVTIESSGKVRTFTLEPNLTYQGAPGDAATLTLQNGVYTLRENDGSLTVFNPNGTLNYTEDTNGNKITADYTGGLLTSFVDSTGDTITFTYNSQGRIIQETDPVGRVTTYTYDPTGQLLLTETDETGTTSYSYGGSPGAVNADALSSIKYPNGTHEYFQYNAHGQMTEQYADGGTEMITYAYDGEGGVTVTNADGGSSTYFLNEFQQVAAYEDPLGNFTSCTYDANNNLVQETGPGGITTTFTNNAAGDTTSTTDANGDTISATYDSLFNNLTSLADANGKPTQYSYDSNGNLLAIAYPDSSQQQFSYDPTGNLIESVDQNGNAISYTYNSKNQLTEEDFADRSKITFAYDAHRNLISATNSSGKTSFTYDSADELTEVTYPNGTYLKFTYYAGGQRKQMVDQTGFTVNYQYDAVGHLSELTDGNGNLIVKYTYDAAGNLVRKDMGNGTYTKYGYDLAGDLTSIVNDESNGTVISSYDYVYDDQGDPISVTTLDGTTTYGYDATGQLISVGLPDGTTIRYQYDDAGNRVAVTNNGATTNYTINDMNEYTQVGSTQYTYDKDGNLISSTDSSGTTSYSYNDLGHLVSEVSSQGTRTYEYDALGNLIAETQNGQETLYLIDPTGIGNVIGTFDGSGNVIDHYTQGIGLTSQVTSTGAEAYYNFDLTGNTTELTGTSGSLLNSYSYLPFGEIASATGTTANPFTYVGQFSVMSDGGGQDFMRNRWYDAVAGRFTQPDPLGLAGGDVNAYRYTANEPVAGIDPAGTFRLGQFLQGVGEAVGGAIAIAASEGPQAVVTLPAGGISIALGVTTISNSFQKEAKYVPGGPGELLGAASPTGRKVGQIADFSLDLLSGKPLPGPIEKIDNALKAKDSLEATVESAQELQNAQGA